MNTQETFSRSKSALGLVGWIMLAFVVAAIGSIASVNAGSFYRELIQPSWSPPAWVFGPVWTVLYFLMGVAAWLVWKQHGFRGARIALSLFLVQLVANGLWSWLFFAWQKGFLAVVEIHVLWILILATLIAFWRVKRLAGILLVPYLVWVSFAMMLSISLLKLNPGPLG